MHSPKSRNGRSRLVFPPQSVTTSSDFPRSVAIGKLSNEVLLRIFRHFVDAFPRLWPSLVHICHKWRRIVFASQRVLHLRLFCTHGTPVVKTIDHWPALPIVVDYGGSPALDPSSEDDDNIVAVLKRSNRVSSIRLALTRSLLVKVSSIDVSFLGLQELALLSPGNVQLVLPSTFHCVPQLRTLHSTGVAFPALAQLLYSAKNLVDLQLREIPCFGYFSPKSFRNALSGMTQLRSLSLHFLPAADYIGVCPSGSRVILPVLTYLKYQGTSEYLDNLVARIDAPRLGDIEFTFFDEFMFDVSNLSEFINRVEIQRLHRQADILFSERSVSILLTQPAVTCLKLQVICDPLRRQVSSIAQICSRFSAFLFRVEDLRIKSTRQSNRQDGAERWLKLICSFKGMKWFHVAGDFSTNIVLALHQSGRRRETVLPAMHKLCIRDPEPHCAPSSLRTAVLSFMVTRRLSGHFIAVEYERREIVPST
ncbi:hypothetical protein EDB83DRAFT_1009872 [Lactarius deliciosus]|nr:hypothetical protein EDB83DRAFT_1009872 [Lactarius deliciosus]